MSTSLFRKFSSFIGIKGLSRRFIYSDAVMKHYNNPKHIGSLNPNDTNVGRGLVGAPACGDVMKMEIRVEDGIITDAKHKVFGCGSAIASSDYATGRIIGKNLKQALSITNVEIAKHLKLPPVKLHCSMLSEDAIKAAVKNYAEKNGISIP